MSTAIAANATPISHVTQGHTLVNPDRLNETQLREALHKANLQLMAQDMRLHTLTGVMDHMAKDLARLVVAHRNQNGSEVYRLLEAITTNNVMFVNQAERLATQTPQAEPSPTQH